MQGLRLDHASLNTVDVDSTVAFYRHFLNLTPGWRPDFGFGGAWLYPEDSDYALVHLIEAPATDPGGMFNHVAFRGRGLAGYIAKVKAANAWFEVMPVPGTSFTQVHHLDPNGVKIEVLFDELLVAESTDVVR